MTTYRSNGNIEFQQQGESDRPSSLITDVDHESDSSKLTDVEDGEDYKICDCIDDTKPGLIPYKTIYDVLHDRDEADEIYFKPGKTVSCAIASAKVIKAQGTTDYIFQVKLNHDNQIWVIDKRRSDFEQLHNKLVLFVQTQRPPRVLRFFKRKRSTRRRGSEEVNGNRVGIAAPRRHFSTSVDNRDWSQEDDVKPAQYKTSASVGMDEDGDEESNRNIRTRTESSGRPKRRRAHRMPDFPAKDRRGTQDVSVTKDQLQTYLNGILHIRSLRNHKETAKFLQVCRLSFIENLGKKFMEGEAHKRPGGRLDYNSIGRLLHERFTPNYARWFILKESYLAYLHPGTDRVREVMLFDNAFDTEVHVAPDANADHGLYVKNHGRVLLVQFKAEQEARSWKEAIDNVVSNEGKEWRQVQQFGSTYPPRLSAFAQWFVDGSSYFEHAAHMMEMAREEIFIAGWWVTPEIFLKRPPQRHNDRYALSALLKRKAQEGVHVFVLLYQEYDQLLDNGSLHAEKTFMDLHPNIVVGRHPSQTIPTPWAHHEKILIVDQCVAFAGGIDLCFGRWDTHEHKLIDLGTMNDQNTRKGRSVELAPDQADKLERANNYLQGEDYQKLKSLMMKNTESIQQRKQGKMKEMFEHLRIKKDETQILMNEYNRMMADIGSLEDACLETAQGAYWIGKDYTNWYVSDVSGHQLPYCDQIDRTKIARTPWHDVQCVVYGAPARDLARHFIQRWNQNKEEQLNDDDKFPRHPFIVPKSYENLKVPPVFQRNSIKCTVQILRSATNWSIGSSVTEHSIELAYKSMIEDAQHYVYIENQFFMSMIQNSYVTNIICQALFDRIVKAHKSKENFRVFIFMPILPAFVGEVGTVTVSGTVLSNLLYFTYGSISKGRQSLLECLEREVGDYSKYIAFFSLRTHGRLGGKLVDSVVYIHTKAIVVDDKKALIASANINDRSMLGSRDSEVGIYVVDEEFTQSRMNGTSFSAGKFGKSFRRRLMAEHLGLIDAGGRIVDSTMIDLNDPVSDEFWSKFKQISRNNTDIFDRVFKCWPNDNVTSWEALERYKLAYKESSLAIADPREAELLLAGLKGYVVDFPTKFLQSADLAPPVIPDSMQFPFT